ncbi:hypothetical protein KUCAC02_000360, partial [Chaenocephalus aceratus]
VRGQNSSESTFRLLDSNKDGSLSVEELQEKLVLVQEEELLLSEEEAVALMGGGRQMDLPMFQHSLWDVLNTENRVKIRGIVDAEDTHLKAADTAAEREASSLKKVEEAYDTINMEISDLRKKLAIDYGPDWEFLFLNSQCYQLNVYEYTYNLCPFNQVTQKSTAGTEVSLGPDPVFLLLSFFSGVGDVGGDSEDPYSQMVYENGETLLARRLPQVLQ